MLEWVFDNFCDNYFHFLENKELWKMEQWFLPKRFFKKGAALFMKKKLLKKKKIMYNLTTNSVKKVHCKKLKGSKSYKFKCRSS